MTILVSSVSHPAYAIKTINDNSTGGDCQSSSSIGTWNVATNTCTLSKDIAGEGIVIGDNNVILDGNGHTVSGTSGNGIFVQIRQGVTIKNIKIQNFDTGIYIDNSKSITVVGNTIAGSNNIGLSAYNSDTLTFTGNVITSANMGIFTSSINSIILTGNKISGSNNNGIELDQSNQISLSSNSISNSNNDGIFIQGGSGSAILTGNTLSNNKANGIMVNDPGSNTVTSNIVSSNGNGLSMGGSKNTISGNTITGNGDGILMGGSSNTITKNAISSNGAGLFLTAASSIVVYDNTISNNNQGITSGYNSNYGSGFSGSFYNNNFINNGIQVSQASGNPFSLNPPVGGNYWSDYSTTVQGCTDSNSDDFCDTPYPFSGGTVGVSDKFPWVIQNGWHTVITTGGDITTTLVGNATSKVVSYTPASATQDSSPISVICTPTSGSSFPMGKTIVVCTASTGVKASFTVTVQTQAQSDTTPPVIVPPPNQVVTATSSQGAIVNYPAPTATDNVGVTNGPTCTPSSGSTFAMGTTIVTCTASDAVGNVAHAMFTVIVQSQTSTDTTPPVIVPPQNQVVTATSSQGAIVNYPAPTATDNVGVTNGPTCTPNSGTVFPVGITTVTCTASDAAVNVGQATFTVTVQQSQSSIPTPSTTTTVSTDKSSYAAGDSIVVSGTVNPLNSVNPEKPVTIQTYDTHNELVRIDLAVPTSNGQFFVTIPAHGPLWQNSGTYTLKIQYDQPSSASTLTFYFNSGNVSTLPAPTSIQQIDITSGGALNVGFSTDPANPSVSGSTQLKINFLDKHTNSVEQQIDYKVIVNQGSNQVFETPTSHSAEGSISIPIQFQNGGTYSVIVEVNGVSFQPIPQQSATFSLSVVGPENTQPTTPQFTPTQQDIQNIDKAKASQTIAAEVNVGANQAQTTSIDNNVSVQTTSNTPDSLNVNVSAPSETGPKVIAFNLAATTINVENLKDLGVMYDGKLIQPAPNMDAILHAKSTDNPSFAIVVTQSGVQVLVLVPHFSTHSITITNMSKVIPTVPEFPFAMLVMIIAILSIILIQKMKLAGKFNTSFQS